MIDLLIDGLAAWRLTHLVVDDQFPPVARTRERVLERYGPDHPASYLVSCHWCVGVWAAAGVTLARILLPRMSHPVVRGLAVAVAPPLFHAAIGFLEEG